MNLGGEIFPAFNPYNKPTYEIHISGCTRKCKGCHNKELQNFNFGSPLNLDSYIPNLIKKEKFFDAISIVGGDLLCQKEEDALEFISLLRKHFPDKDLWLFTGATEEELPLWAKELFDYIKVGCYKEELKQIGFPSSSNQKVLKFKRKIEYAD